MQRTEIVPFPGAALLSRIAQEKPASASPQLGAVLPKRRPDDAAKLRIEIAALRGLLTDRQLAQLNRHQRLLEDYGHLLQLYISPHESLDLDAVPEAEREVHVARVRRTALALLLPTERDTLANTIKTLTASLAATVQLQRTVAGLAAGKGREDETTGGERVDLNKFDTPTSARVREAMQLLQGDRERRSAPPVPAPPESIEDLRSPLDPPAGG